MTILQEAYLHRRCQERIRGYLYKTIDQIRSSDIFLKDPCARKQLLYVISFFKMQLKQDHYFGHYFDRSRAKIEAPENVDERDSSTCYEHCPCRLSHVSGSAYFRLFGTMNQSCVDGAKKKTKDELSVDSKTEEEEAEGNCPYTIRRNGGEACVAMCDRKGDFRCGGIWNAEKCSYGERHKINPYRSREDLILFSTWNFDHK